VHSVLRSRCVEVGARLDGLAELLVALGSMLLVIERRPADEDAQPRDERPAGVVPIERPEDPHPRVLRDVLDVAPRHAGPAYPPEHTAVVAFPEAPELLGRSRRRVRAVRRIRHDGWFDGARARGPRIVAAVEEKTKAVPRGAGPATSSIRG